MVFFISIEFWPSVRFEGVYSFLITSKKRIPSYMSKYSFEKKFFERKLTVWLPFLQGRKFNRIILNTCCAEVVSLVKAAAKP